MINEYFSRVESIFEKFTIIRSYTVKKKIYSARQGFISATIVFANNHSLQFTEVKDTNKTEKIKYRYQYMDENHGLIFRYDNAYHHRDIKTFPHHKHLSGSVKECSEPNLEDILLEIAELIRQTNKF